VTANRGEQISLPTFHETRTTQPTRGNAMPEPTYDELKAQLAALQEKVKSRDRRALEFRVSEKGAVSLYGLGRFPVTLYYEQWMKVLDHVDELRAFLEENKPNLKLKQSE
jgi:phage I-like protein